LIPAMAVVFIGRKKRESGWGRSMFLGFLGGMLNGQAVL
jgi:hypothetical protein